MSCCLTGAKPLFGPVLVCCLLDPENQNTGIFTQETKFGNIICKMASILSRSKCVNAIAVRTLKYVRALCVVCFDHVIIFVELCYP